jgi:sec-independent protein translocase protein TatA
MGFLNLGGWEWVILLVIVLIIFGGSRLPGLFKALGQGVKEFRDASKDENPDAKMEAEKPAASAEEPRSSDKPTA